MPVEQIIQPRRSGILNELSTSDRMASSFTFMVNSQSSIVKSENLSKRSCLSSIVLYSVKCHKISIQHQYWPLQCRYCGSSYFCCIKLTKNLAYATGDFTKQFK
jgi:hypothetical protein